MAEIKIIQVDGDSTEIVVIDSYGEEYNVASVNHDEHGWSGMEMAEEMAKEIGHALGIKVTNE